jgi:hypothetical protein
VKLDPEGNIEWQKCLGGNEQEWFQSIIEDSDGGFTCAGYTGSFSGDVSGRDSAGYYDAWVVKLDRTGNMLWEKSPGGNNGDELNSIIHTSDGGYALAGFTASNDESFFNHANGSSWDAWVLKLNRIGEFQWQKCLGGAASDLAYSIIRSADGEGYVIAGETNSTDGDVSGQHGGLPFYGEPFTDAWIVKLGASSFVDWQQSLQFSLSAYPNPAANFVTLAYDLPAASAIGIQVYDVTGKRMKEIHRSMQTSGHHEQPLDLSGLAEGSYFISLSACSKIERQMVQVIR